MPNPTVSDAHVNRPLTNISVAFMQEATDFVADQMFAVVPVAKQSDRYFVYDRADFFRSEMQKRAPSTESAGGGYRIDNTPTYYADVWAIHKDVDDDIRGNFDDPLDPDRDATAWLSLQGLLRKDKQWVAQYFATGKWTGDQTGVDAAPAANQFLRWNVTASTPIKDLRTQVYVVKKRTGLKPNKLALGAEVWAILQDHPDFLDRIKYTQTAMVSPGLLAAVLELSDVLIASGVEVTTEEEAATDTFAFLAGKHALLAHSAPTPSILTPSAGYTFSWTGRPGTGGMGQRVSSFRIDEIKSDRIEMEMAFDMKLVAADLGVFFATAIA